MLKRTGRDLLVVALLTLAAVLIHGYHVGTEDQAIYLPAIKKNLDPGLYPFDSMYFMASTRLTLFDELVAFSVHATGLPLEVVLFSWHVLTIFLFLLACLQLSRRCFVEPVAQWAGVSLMTVILTLPIAGTLLLIWAQYLHPRAFAAVALMFALLATLDRKPRALAWFAVAACLHPLMAVHGGIHLGVLAWWPGQANLALSLLSPIHPWEPSNAAWRELLQTRRDFLILRWTWYEWLGALAPLMLLAWIARGAKKRGADLMARVSSRVALTGALVMIATIVMNSVPALHRFLPLQPMRSLHLVYVVLCVLGGGLIGKHVLSRRASRWVLFFAPLCAVMFYANHLQFPSSPHIEWPGVIPENPWARAFDWIRQNTPRDALFALDPDFMKRPGQDFRGFRACAERSMLADRYKDGSVVALFPGLTYSWRQEVKDRRGWDHFTVEDFRRIKQKHGVTWVVVERPVAGLSCQFQTGSVRVCRID